MQYAAYTHAVCSSACKNKTTFYNTCHNCLDRKKQSGFKLIFKLLYDPNSLHRPLSQFLNSNTKMREPATSKFPKHLYPIQTTMQIKYFPQTYRSFNKIILNLDILFGYCKEYPVLFSFVPSILFAFKYYFATFIYPHEYQCRDYFFMNSITTCHKFSCLRINSAIRCTQK